MTKNYLRYTVAAAAFFLVSGTSNVAFAVVEMEPNEPVTSAQRLVIGSDGSVAVTGAIGLVTLGGTPIGDVDFYSFQARAGDVVTVDIDGGMKSPGSSVRSLDSVLAIYGPDLAVLRQIDDTVGTPDSGSVSRFDARLDNVNLPVSGMYTVGVTSSGRTFLPGGGVTSFVPRTTSNGSYTLIISGVTPSVQQISIEIKPGAGSIAPINPKAKGNIPVALLWSPEFDPLKADPGSIKFGPSGTEATALRCGKGGEDVNGDGRLDLVCHFDNQAAGFGPSDEEGMVTGTIGGLPFEGRGWLKVIPVKREN